MLDIGLARINAVIKAAGQAFMNAIIQCSKKSEIRPRFIKVTHADMSKDRQNENKNV
jgi:hypothetical protein